MSPTSEAEGGIGKTEVKERIVENDGVKGRDLLNEEDGVGRVAGRGEHSTTLAASKMKNHR